MITTLTKASLLKGSSSRLGPLQALVVVVFFFLIFFEALYYINTSMEMDPFIWSISPSPTKPFVKAVISLNSSDQIGIVNDLITGTYANTGLTVQNGSILIMICLANFPIRWYKDNDKAPLQQSANSNPSLDPWAPWWTESEDRINASTVVAISDYTTSLYLGTVTANKSGVYTCRYPGSKEEYFTTVIKLSVNIDPAPTIHSNEPKILQTGFDRVEVSDFPSLVIIPVTFIYFKPNDLKCNEYLLSPTGDTLEPDERQTLAWTPRHEITWTIDFPGKKDQGFYQFVFEYQSKNGSSIKRKYFFEVIVTRKVAQQVYAFRNIFEAYLSLGRVYEISLVRLDIEEMNLPKAEIELLFRPGGDCWNDYEITSDMAYEKCGLIGVTTLEGVLYPGIVLLINMTGTCKILANMSINNGSTIDNETYLLNTIAVDNIFESATINQPVIQAQPIVNVNTMLTNKTFKLRCMVPMCSWVSIQWCKRTSNDCGGPCAAAWSYDRYPDPSSKEEIIEDAAINFSFHQVNPYTIAYDLTFSSLQLNHTGWWSCAVNRLWWLTESSIGMQMYPTADINLLVKDPVAPVFIDGKQSTVHHKKLEKNGQIDLLCKVTGFPPPTISWWQLDKNWLIGEENNSDTIEVQEPGNYECIVENDYGNISRRFVVHYYEGVSTLPIAISIPPVTIVILASFGFLFWRRRRAKAMLFKELSRLLKKQPPDNVAIDADLPLNDQTDILTYNQNYEVERNLFKLDQLIGQGEFGKVFKGELKSEGTNETRSVAVKVPRDPTNLQHYEDLIAELKIMTFIEKHVNVVTLVGACTSNIKNNYKLYVLTEFCEYGSLKEYLTKHWQFFESFALTSHEESKSAYSLATDPLLNYAYQAANGMEYLALKNIIHRDLALRNLLLASGQVVKISDFGMSRYHQTIYQKHFLQNDLVPIRWMALESIISGQYTQKSDVWSFGVVLWELFSCKTPYAQEGLSGISTLVVWLQNGCRMDKPRIAPEELYGLMLDCWKEDPSVRPTFSECKRRIGRNLEENSPAMYSTVQKILCKAGPNLLSTSQSTKAHYENTSAPALDTKKCENYLRSDFKIEAPIDFVVNQGYVQQGDDLRIRRKESKS